MMFEDGTLPRLVWDLASTAWFVYLTVFYVKHKHREASRMLGKEREKLLAILAEMDKKEEQG